MPKAGEEFDTSVDAGRRRVPLACTHCRSRKIRCDGEDPCKACRNSGRDCKFEKVTAEENQKARERKARSSTSRGLVVRSASSTARARSAGRKNYSPPTPRVTRSAGSTSTTQPVASSAQIDGCDARPAADGSKHKGSAEEQKEGTTAKTEGTYPPEVEQDEDREWVGSDSETDQDSGSEFCLSADEDHGNGRKAPSTLTAPSSIHNSTSPSPQPQPPTPRQAPKVEKAATAPFSTAVASRAGYHPRSNGFITTPVEHEFGAVPMSMPLPLPSQAITNSSHPMFPSLPYMQPFRPAYTMPPPHPSMRAYAQPQQQPPAGVGTQPYPSSPYPPTASGPGLLPSPTIFDMPRQGISVPVYQQPLRHAASPGRTIYHAQKPVNYRPPPLSLGASAAIPYQYNHRYYSDSSAAYQYPPPVPSPSMPCDYPTYTQQQHHNGLLMQRSGSMSSVDTLSYAASPTLSTGATWTDFDFL